MPAAPLRGDLGIHEVAARWTRAGCRVEPVGADYGEDLMVQTQLNDEVEPYRIWVQVKTAWALQPSKAGRYHVRLSIDHLYKWDRMIEPVFVCVFEVRTGRAF